jgi:hypothetical protein
MPGKISPASAFLVSANCISPASAFRVYGHSSCNANHELVRHCLTMKPRLCMYNKATKVIIVMYIHDLNHHAA